MLECMFGVPQLSILLSVIPLQYLVCYHPCAWLQVVVVIGYPRAIVSIKYIATVTFPCASHANQCRRDNHGVCLLCLRAEANLIHPRQYLGTESQPWHQQANQWLMREPTQPTNTSHFVRFGGNQDHYQASRPFHTQLFWNLSAHTMCLVNRTPHLSGDVLWTC